MGKSADRLIGIVHGQSHAVAFKIIHLVFDHGTVFPFKLNGEFPFSFGHKIAGTVLIAKSMTTDTDRRCPVGYQAWDIFHNDGFAEYRTVENIADGAIRRLPHLFESE